MKRKNKESVSPSLVRKASSPSVTLMLMLMMTLTVVILPHVTSGSNSVSFPTTSSSSIFGGKEHDYRDHPRERLKELLSRRESDPREGLTNNKEDPPTERQSVQAADYSDLKGKYGYFPPSMFKDYMETAREKMHNTLSGQIDSRGIFHPANTLGTPISGGSASALIGFPIVAPIASPNSDSKSSSGTFVNPSHSPSSIKIGETPATAASRDQRQQGSSNPNERMGLLGSMAGLGMYGGGMYGMPYGGIYPPFMGGYGMHSMYPYGGYGMAAYNPYLMGMYGGYGGYGGYGIGYGGMYGPWYRSENGGPDGGHGGQHQSGMMPGMNGQFPHHAAAASDPHQSQAVNLGGGVYPNNSFVNHNSNMNGMNHHNNHPLDHLQSQFPAYIPSPHSQFPSHQLMMNPGGLQPQQVPPRENYYGFPPSFAAASSPERDFIRPNEKWKGEEEDYQKTLQGQHHHSPPQQQQSNNNNNQNNNNNNQNHPSSLSPLMPKFPYSYSLPSTDMSSASSLLFPYPLSVPKTSSTSPSLSSSPSSAVKHLYDFLEGNTSVRDNSNPLRQGLSSSASSSNRNKLHHHHENEKDSDRYYSSSSSMMFPSSSSSVVKSSSSPFSPSSSSHYNIFSSPSTIETVGYF